MVFLIKRAEWKKMLICCGSFLCAAFVFGSTVTRPVPAFSPSADGAVPATVIIDPGHGGEDGGAVSADGVIESHINLAVALQLNDILRFSGVPTVLTRDADISTCDDGLETVRKRKASDIRNRVALVEETANSVLLSIHQNSLPSSPITHGAQAFWNEQNSAEVLAESIQTALNLGINHGNEKLPKKISPTVYLMKHITAPGVLVECGFLTNAEETGKLQQSSYQRGLALSIAAGYLQSRTKGEPS